MLKANLSYAQIPDAKLMKITISGSFYLFVLNVLLMLEFNLQ